MSYFRRRKYISHVLDEWFVYSDKLCNFPTSKVNFLTNLPEAFLHFPRLNNFEWFKIDIFRFHFAEWVRVCLAGKWLEKVDYPSIKSSCSGEPNGGFHESCSHFPIYSQTLPVLALWICWFFLVLVPNFSLSLWIHQLFYSKLLFFRIALSFVSRWTCVELSLSFFFLFRCLFFFHSYNVW